MRVDLTLFALLVACGGCSSSPSEDTDGGTGGTAGSSGMPMPNDTSGSTSEAEPEVDSSGTGDDGDSSGSSGEDVNCWSEPITLAEIDDAFGGFFAQPQGVVADGGEVWIGYGEFGSITPGFRYRLFRGTGDMFSPVDLPDPLLYGVELLDAPTPTIAVTRWSEDAGAQVWRWIDEAWVVEDVSDSGQHVVGDVADDGSVHLMYSLFDDTVMYATDANGPWESEPVPGAVRPLGLTMESGEPLALVTTSRLVSEPTSVVRRDGDMWSFTSTGVTKTASASTTGVGRVHGSTEFLQLDNDANSVWLIDATDPAAPVLVGGEGLYSVSDAQRDGDVLHFGWGEFEEVYRVEFSGGSAQAELIDMSADEGPGTIAGDPYALVWRTPSPVYASCPR